ncbi:hypothetical protein E2F46_01795 [Luteimonas aestuarii]|uniref:Uncharacterized protein n=1 Tax=Luteimonas aestuarii TaxID=453837 RepID=A0A4R5U4J1_9GAMM|nr:hypothetical protein [Luteimonas aestuarii]TDK28638.1 hypothetical protein E2F46_01795 [Luteimonas aestuarii]
MSQTQPRPGDDDALAGLEAETGEVGVFTRIYSGQSGDIVLTVRARDAQAASLLSRICGAGVEAAVFRMYRERLLQH